MIKGWERDRINLWRIWFWGLIILLPIAVAAQGTSAGAQTGPGNIAVALAPLTLSADRVLFDAQVGTTLMLTWDIDVSDDTGSGAPTYTASVQSGGDWLLVGNTSEGTTIAWGASVTSTIPGVLRVFARVMGLSAGIHTGSVAVKATGAAGDPVVVPVILNVRNSPFILVRPTALSFSYQALNPFNYPEPQTLSVFGANTDFHLLVSTSDGSWLTVTPLESTTPAVLTVSVQPDGLDPGVYQGTISITGANADNGGAVTATVTLRITEPSAYVALPSAVELQAQYGSHAPVSRGLSLYTNGMLLPVSPSPLNLNWLSVTALDSWAGVYDPGSVMILPIPSRLRVYADPTGLAVGTYTNSFVVEDQNSSITIPVTFRIVPNELIIPRVMDGGGWSTSITLVNTDSEAAPFTLKFRRQDGTPMVLPIAPVGLVSQYTNTIPVGGMMTIQTLGLDSNLSQGWAELIPQRSIGGRATIRRRGVTGESTAVVPVAPPAGKHFMLPFDNTGGNQTDLTLVNSGASASAISLSLRDETSNWTTTVSITVPPYAARELQLRNAYPQLINQRGVAEFTAPTESISAIGLRSNLQGPLSSFQPVVFQSSSDTVTRTVPQVVDGLGWKTTFVLVNPGSKPTPFSLVFHDVEGGYPLGFPLESIGEVEEYSDVIPAGSLRIIETAGASDSIVPRWAELVSSSVIGGTVVFTQEQSDGSRSEASLPISAPYGDRFVLPFDNSADLTTAVALLNEGVVDKLTTAILRDENGKRLLSEYMPLVGGASQTFFLSDRFPATNGIRGTIEFFGAQFPVLGLNFGPLGSFSSVSAINK